MKHACRRHLWIWIFNWRMRFKRVSVRMEHRSKLRPSEQEHAERLAREHGWI